ncbi:MAG: amidophosphoribosyltransferase [Omnitrophica WOR_2 bacterium GWF2_38_59]|nr:MAG: amidophosphoribosyltransferase [Omnitrophica WOR_2 bacterium GWA2_37_7]OGX22326.1 MAG: amidophosphoribosyltransferase [Omnitrophica WOR_2 bacterium GWF2_38_59]OGX50267.1 MAG: amidophosphoribosyltransferase [Omnitrophica WOR_2 bacterium RIFOXYA2_FULL_38_17]OGX56724.1 MAG: amidophosphoribosyltransferase [Omnitrophica WOR_2 bacterium RIFOXYB2_FULL_38_16]HBG61226.1 amidophosphoribosyltransferase [Candidatus Omnitrophota bacterium]
MCGIIGVSNIENASRVAMLGLHALQHRGEEAAGIASYDGQNVHIIKNTGLVDDAISAIQVAELKGSTAVGHCRYSTTGSSNYKNIQPFLVTHKKKRIAVAHNGNLTNTEELYKKLEEEGSIFQTTMDSEIIVHLLVKTKNGDLKQWFSNVLSQLQGAFSLIFLIEDTIVGARDRNGFRPLSIGKLDGKYILASESCALDLLQAEFVREVEPGEIVIVKGDKLESVFMPGTKEAKRSYCIFENIYFARPDSDIFHDNVYQVRKRLGAQLAKEHPADADFVMAIPDSGNYAALGYANEMKMPFEVGIIRNHYVGRTFIQPTQLMRDFRVRVKLNPIRSVLKDKKIIVVEDSIVRGTTSRSRIEALRRAGAKEIHMRISCPPIKWPCFYGIDFPSKNELIASNKKVKEIADFIKVDSLEYLSLEGMLSVMNESGNFCDACFTGNYPVAIPTNKSKYLLE